MEMLPLWKWHLSWNSFHLKLNQQRNGVLFLFFGFILQFSIIFCNFACVKAPEWIWKLRLNCRYEVTVGIDVQGGAAEALLEVALQEEEGGGRRAGGRCVIRRFSFSFPSSLCEEQLCHCHCSLAREHWWLRRCSDSPDAAPLASCPLTHSWAFSDRHSCSMLQILKRIAACLVTRWVSTTRGIFFFWDGKWSSAWFMEILY